MEPERRVTQPNNKSASRQARLARQQQRVNQQVRGDTVNKRDLVRLTSLDTGISQATVNKVLDGLTITINAALASDRRVLVRGFGSWRTRSQKSYWGRHQGARTVIKGHRRVVFHTGSTLKGTLNPHLQNKAGGKGTSGGYGS